jgi:hypothetical protein
MAARSRSPNGRSAPGKKILITGSRLSGRMQRRFHWYVEDEAPKLVHQPKLLNLGISYMYIFFADAFVYVLMHIKKNEINDVLSEQ